MSIEYLPIDTPVDIVSLVEINWRHTIFHLLCTISASLLREYYGINKYFALAIVINTDVSYAPGHVAFRTLLAFIEAREDNFNIEIMQSRLRLEERRTNVGYTTVVFSIPLIVLDRTAPRRELFAER